MTTCKLHPKYKGILVPTSKKQECTCPSVYNERHKTGKICVTPGCKSTCGVFTNNYLCPSCSND